MTTLSLTAEQEAASIIAFGAGNAVYDLNKAGGPKFIEPELKGSASINFPHP